MKRYVIGDIHGRHQELKKLLEKCNFSYDKDMLIVLGDVVDGGFYTNKVIDELMKIKNLVFVIGNHDQFFINYNFKGRLPPEWLNQGGANTLNSYGGRVIPGTFVNDVPVMVDVNGVKVPEKHIKFFSQGLYYFTLDNMIFVHGGFDPNRPITEQSIHTLTWDRDLIKYADKNNIPKYNKVFIAHTTTQHIVRDMINYRCRDCGHEWHHKFEFRDYVIKCIKCESDNVFESLGSTQPVKINNLYCLDTGAGWSGRLTIMDIDSEEFWQSKLQEPPIMGD